MKGELHDSGVFANSTSSRRDHESKSYAEVLAEAIKIEEEETAAFVEEAKEKITAAFAGYTAIGQEMLDALGKFCKISDEEAAKFAAYVPQPLLHL
jgi:hypothetical protein